MLGGFMVGGAMEGGAIFFLREWRPRDGRSSGDLLSFASPLLSRSRPAMPDRMDRGSPKSSSNSSAFMSILCPCAARARLCCLASCALYGGWWRRRGAPDGRAARGGTRMCPLEAFAACGIRALPLFYSTTLD